MKRRSFLYGLGGAGVLTATRLPSFALQPSASVRISVDDTAPSSVKEAAASIAAAVGHPLLRVMGGPCELTASRKLLRGAFADRAYNHLILVGLPSDPLIASAWQREARLIPGGLYVFGFGCLAGDLGYIESDRNPFLHSREVPVAPFETEVVTITGNTFAGVELAVHAFLTQHLVNGIVAAPGWRRPTTGLLDRDPLDPDFSLPELAPAQISGNPRIGVSQSSEDEYRGVLADTSFLPLAIWRAKYFTAGAWSAASGVSAFDAYSFGLHRRAYGNTRWIAQFASASEATQAAPRIAAAAQLKHVGTQWTGNQAFYGDSKKPTDPGHGPLVLWQSGTNILMSTIPDDHA